MRRGTCRFCNGTGKLSESMTADLVEPEDIRAIIAEECDLAGLEVGDVVGPRQFNRLIPTRFKIAYRLWDELELPLKTIGFYLGGRNTSTIIHAIRRHQGIPRIRAAPFVRAS